MTSSSSSSSRYPAGHECQPRLRRFVHIGSHPSGERPYGLPRKRGTEPIPTAAWDQVWEFIASRSWYLEELSDPADLEDPLVGPSPAYGTFMLGFDFHLTPDGPRLIEINTNAGGLATVFSLADPADQQCLQAAFVAALLAEYTAATGLTSLPRLVAIVDENVEQQPMYPEMAFYAALLGENGIPCIVVSPSDLVLNSEQKLVARADGRRVDVVYNRLTDFRLREPAHQHLRISAVAGQVAITPHPAAYARVADKRNLSRLRNSSVVPPTQLFAEQPVAYWAERRKQLVFKPAEGNGSRGVYRGDKLSLDRLARLDPDTVVQQLCPPPLSAADGTKFDLRVFTSNTHLLGIATRHFTGQVMEMRSPQSGFRVALPEGIVLYRQLVAASCAEAPSDATADRCRGADVCGSLPAPCPAPATPCPALDGEHVAEFETPAPRAATRESQPLLSPCCCPFTCCFPSPAPTLVCCC